ncbi:cryptochrome/photolyase family protein [Vibrio viridaestus]|uniref:cryptochrome/photolyase family protein n=1 Tax=Vibrio viridaestus TaxID=2487322 RepID=UPI001AA09F12|nr:cryptochrome/photolyase family protein [Vibrio viridaestus]
MPQTHTLRLILGDQLNASHSWFKSRDNSVLYVIAELHQETDYTIHHVQKICAFFSAMQQFAEALKKAGHQVLYLTLEQTSDFGSLPDLIRHLISQYGVSQFSYQRPDEYRLLKQLQNMVLECGVQMVDTEHFLLSYDEIPRYFKANKHQKMEFFYRKMRAKFALLMDGSEPEGGKWNYDQANRKKLKKQDLQQIPQPLCFENDVTDIVSRLKKHNITTMGKVHNPLLWPTNRSQARELLDHFCYYNLPFFGHFQDAMTECSEHQWSLYHSRLSFAINAKILHPLYVVRRAIEFYREQKAVAEIDLAQIEGFTRQIIGWREFVRGVYWINMPHYIESNTLQAKHSLPDFFWSGETSMNCLHHSITQSLEYSYAHHIQRLMVIGNYCLISERNPDEVDEWYLGVYVDALDWVEKPNTRGMALFADGGLLATKPYAASGNYINKMSDYCQGCKYKVKETVGEDACPFNSLYWHFMVKHRERLSTNPRVGMLFGNWDKRDDGEKQNILNQAEKHILGN